MARKRLWFTLLILLTATERTAAQAYWKATQRIVPDDFRYGSSLALYDKTVVAGTFSMNEQFGDVAYVYNCTVTSQCVLAQRLSERGRGFFGQAVAVFEETVTVGSTDPNSDEGLVYVYQCASDANCVVVQILTAADGKAWDQFGACVALSGSTLVVGAWGHEAAYTFHCVTSGSVGCVYAGKLVAGDGERGDYFGCGVAASDALVVVGAFYNDRKRGAAYVYDCSALPGGACLPVNKLVASDAVDGDFFGGSVAASGKTVIVGAHRKDNYSGAAYLYDCAVGNCIDADVIRGSDYEGYLFGWSVVIDGATVLVGEGFVFHCPTPFECTHSQMLATEGGDALGERFAIKGTLAVALGYWYNQTTHVSSLYVYEHSGR